MMEDLTKPVATASEQGVAPVVTPPSEPSQTVESTAPVETAKPEPKPEPKQAEDPDAVLRRVREQARRELESEFGKRQSEAIRAEKARAAAEHEALLTELGQYAPDDAVAKARQTIQEKGLRERLAYYEQKAAEDAARQGEMEQVRNLEAMVQDAGLSFKDLPKDVIGDSPVGFTERFARFTAKKLRDALADADKREKKAREEAERETEKRLGVSRVSGSTPTGSSHTGLEELSEELASAAARGDKARVSELRDALYKEAGIGR
jgi:hypothetical protein